MLYAVPFIDFIYKCRVQIIEKNEGTAKTDMGTVDPQWTQLRKCKESKWIIKLRTVYQYELHDRNSEDIESTNNEIVGINFPT